MRPALLLALAMLALGAIALAAPVDGHRLLASGLAFPVDLAFRPDGALLLAELNTGNVRELRSDGTTSAVLAHVPASPGGNGGFTGLAVDPSDARTLYV